MATSQKEEKHSPDKQNKPKENKHTSSKGITLKYNLSYSKGTKKD